ncbi:MAG: helix-hairpin-helix domain-containing protein [Solirubrobacteraceae bacterium]
MPSEPDLQALTTIPNVGPAVARKLLQLGVTRTAELRGQDADDLFERLCALDGRRHDPCLLDTFTAAVAYANGEPARPSWEYSRARLARSVAPRGGC